MILPKCKIQKLQENDVNKWNHLVKYLMFHMCVCVHTYTQEKKHYPDAKLNLTLCRNKFKCINSISKLIVEF